MAPCNFIPSDRFVKSIEEISDRVDTLTNLFIYADTPARLAEIAQQFGLSRIPAASTVR
jgi:hypothetical protein